MTEFAHATVLLRRYKNAYRVAQVIVGFGSLIKWGGVLLGVLIIIAFRATSGFFYDNIIIFGIAVGAGFYLQGVILSAIAQILQACLDTAINSSPFLTNEHRIEIMSLEVLRNNNRSKKSPIMQWLKPD